MANEENEEPEEGATTTAEGQDGEAAAPSSRGPLKLLGAVIGLISTGLVLAVMATPKSRAPERFRGPDVHAFFGPDGELVANTRDDNFSRYVKFRPSCSFLAYDLEYPDRRREDPQYEAVIEERMQTLISGLVIDEIMAGTNREVFAAKLEEVAEPVLFPVHVGETELPFEEDPASGLRVGESQDRHGTFRGHFHRHVLKVDAPAGTVQLDEGPVAHFDGDEYDLLVEDPTGKTIYLDVTTVREDFVGEVQVGVMGRIRELFTGDILVQ